jgi:hypothetical protein
MDYRPITIQTAIATVALAMLAAGCSLLPNRSAQQTQLQAQRANAAADRAEKSAQAAEKAARDAMAAADHAEKTVHEDSKAIDADVARINYLIAMHDRELRRRRRSKKHHHHVKHLAHRTTSATKPVAKTPSPAPDAKEE